VSHGQLLIRSPKSQTAAKNLDLIFRGVAFLTLPSVLRGIQITEPTRAEVEQYQGIVGPRCEPPAIHVLRSEDKRFWVAAASFEVRENDLEIFEDGLGIG
jgi:hypothetical protein